MKKKRVKNTRKITKKKVKTVEIKRISTGVENLDKLSGDGFIEKSITLVAGGAGSGKTILAMQFLWEGLKEGDACLYITF